MTQRTLVGIIAAIALILGGVLSIYIAPPAPKANYFQAYPQPRALSDFGLTAHSGEMLSPDWLEGKWTLTFVGYTFCPDICPTTLVELKRIYPDLQSIQSEQPIQVLFISVDPARDTTERLAEYIAFFHPEFVAASAEHKVLYPLIRSMGMMYAIADDTSDGEYLVDHSGSVVVINPNGHVVGRFKPVMEPGKLAVSDGEQIITDMPYILENYGNI
ncbi:SCO family protein [Aestuariibacter sp. AA17]|uniref:SCO family protein n=1 Tax=Fluctibacter corallii TaxID=2984329 RepID=A0ABT3AAZ1_9ALTE|nr:SCO family protein [Aestuariibacter sp. AA17]MCV2885835.1 SCO family protein [Aestuariibacter sp. AA17]